VSADRMFATEVKVLRCSACGNILMSIPVYDRNQKFEGIHYKHPLMASTRDTPCKWVGRVFESNWPVNVKMDECTQGFEEVEVSE
jgi:hypothetical protein